MESIDLNDLSKIPGIGPTTADKLMKAGYKTIPEVSVITVDELALITGVNKLKAREAINFAKEIGLNKALPIFTFSTQKKEIDDKIQYFSTGSRELDKLIGGGVATNEITGLRGKYSTGKTQICYSCAIECIKQGRKVAWIETEPGTFKTKRFQEIADAKGVKFKDDDILIMNARFIRSPNQQFGVYQRYEFELKKGVDIGLIIIDSFSPKFREFYTRREMFPARSQELMRHLGFLQGLAAEYNLAVLLTNQVMGIPDSGKQLEVKKEEGGADTGMVLGHAVKHSVQTWISLRFKSKTGNVWDASLFDSSYMPKGTIEFTIGPGGVADVTGTGGRG